MPTPAERERLQLTAGVPVITLLRTAFDTAGRAVEVCDTVKSAQSYVLEYRVDATRHQRRPQATWALTQLV